ncbi:MAG: sulfite exporter TauE/SafE family protein [Anaerolineaceae bacterium]|nr:sulfite exporter TauE/SafE family protein [Anaerolineaceae bacterium]
MEFFHSPIFLPILILFLGALVRTTFGFGDALIEMPLLALVISIKLATPIVAVFGFLLAVAILLREWRFINIRSTWRLILASLIGIPFGVLYLQYIPEPITKLILGIILILTALLNIFYPKQTPTISEGSAYGFGFVAGVLGSAYNTNGPPIVLYGLMRKWDPATFRATMQSYFLPTNLLIIISHLSSGLWTTEAFHLFSIAIPAVFLAFVLGSLIAKHLPTQKFNKTIYAVVLIMGVLLILTCL